MLFVTENASPSNASEIPVSFLLYQNSKLFPSVRLINESVSLSFDDNHVRRRIVGSRVIAAKVEGNEVVDLPAERPIEVYFALITVSGYNYYHNLNK